MLSVNDAVEMIRTGSDSEENYNVSDNPNFDAYSATTEKDSDKSHFWCQTLHHFSIPHYTRMV